MDTPARVPSDAGAKPRCRACDRSRLVDLLRLPEVPTNSCILIGDRTSARHYPRGDIDLALCLDCGLVFNRSFLPELTRYSGEYEETQSFSPAFRRFHQGLAEDLIARYRLRGRRVVEIGCGKGELLLLLSELAGVRGLGYDPGYHPERLAGPAAARVRVIRAFFPAGPIPSDCALVCSKMTLEHVARPGDLLRAIRSGLASGSDAALFIMVPDAGRILRDGAFEDIYYEHCNYFTAGTLAGLIESAGFTVTEIARVYGDQYLCVHARPADTLSESAGAVVPDPRATVPDPTELAHLFARRVSERRESWQARFAHWSSVGRRVVIWGSGSKSLAFVTALGVHDRVLGLVDINPHRQGTWQPGTALPILAPHALPALRPDVVVVMNPLYRDEIAASLAELDLRVELLALGS